MRDQSGLRPLKGHDFPKPFTSNVWSKNIMSLSERLSNADEQTSALSRRDLLNKFLVIALATTTAKLLPQLSIPQSYPSPKFNIGDLIASDWIDEFDNEVTDFGQVLGLRYLPESESIFLANTWVYYIWWTHTTNGPASCYPCYDGEPTSDYDLRLV